MLSAAAATYGSEVLTATLSLGNALIVARALGATGRGDVAFLTAVAYLASNLATIGVEDAIGNIAGRSPGKRRALTGNAVVLSLVFGFIAIGAFSLLIYLVPSAGAGSPTLLLALAAGSIPMLILQVYLRFFVQGVYHFGAANVALLLPAVVNVVANGTFAAFGALTVATALIVWISGQALATLLLGLYILRRLSGFGRPNAKLARESIAFGAKSHPGQIMMEGNYRMDAWILGAMAGTHELGLYSIAVVWAEACFFLPTALAAVQRPDLVRSERREAGRLAAAVFRIAVAATAGLVVVMIIAAPFLTIVIFGDDFAGAIDDLRVLALGAFGVIAMKQLAGALTAQGFPIRSSVAIAIGFVVALVLDVVLIPMYGGLGAAIASTIAYTTGGIAAAVIFSRTLKTPMTKLIPRPRDIIDFADRIRDLISYRRARVDGASKDGDESR